MIRLQHYFAPHPANYLPTHPHFSKQRCIRCEGPKEEKLWILQHGESLSWTVCSIEISRTCFFSCHSPKWDNLKFHCSLSVNLLKKTTLDTGLWLHSFWTIWINIFTCCSCRMKWDYNAIYEGLLVNQRNVSKVTYVYSSVAGTKLLPILSFLNKF